MPRPNTKTEIVKIRVTAQDKVKLESQAEKRGESLSDYIRGKTLKSQIFCLGGGD